MCVSAGACGAVFRWLPGRGRGASLGKSTQTLKKTMKHQKSWVYIYFFILFYFVPSHWFIDWSLRSCPRTCIQYIYHPLHCAVHLRGSRSFNTRAKLIWRSPILPPFFTFFFSTRDVRGAAWSDKCKQLLALCLQAPLLLGMMLRGTPRFFERGQKNKNNEVSVGGSQHLAGGVVPHTVKALLPFVTSEKREFKEDSSWLAG